VKHAQARIPVGKSTARIKVSAASIPLQFGLDANLRHSDRGRSWSVDGDRFIRRQAAVRNRVLRAANATRDLRNLRARRHAGFRDWSLNSLVDAADLDGWRLVFFERDLAFSHVYRLRGRGRDNAAMDSIHRFLAAVPHFSARTTEARHASRPPGSCLD
jgi:hypothetical protein